MVLALAINQLSMSDVLRLHFDAKYKVWERAKSAYSLDTVRGNIAINQLSTLLHLIRQTHTPTYL